eukprot:351844_1
MASTKKTEFTFKYKDSNNKISPNFTYTSGALLTTLSPLYRSRTLRKYNAIDAYDRNTFNLRLYTWPVGNVYIVREPMDCLWALKILFYHKYNMQKPICSARVCYADVFMVILCFVFGFAYFVQCVILLIQSIVALYIFTSIQWLTFAITIVLWKVIIYLTKSESFAIIEPKLKSRYIQKMKMWKNKYNNLSFIKFIKLILLLSTNNYKNRNQNNCSLICDNIALASKIIVWIYLPMLPIFEAYFCSSSNKHQIKMKWVIPDYYDIQEDMKFFILNKLPKRITENNELMHCIYHILNAVVANEIDYCIRSSLNNRGGYNDDNFKNMWNAREIKESYLLCLEKYLKNKICICDKYDIMNEEHTFDFKETCMKDYEYYQQINGYNVKYISINNGYFKRFIGFMFGNAHKYRFPLLFVFVFMNITGLVTLWYMGTVSNGLMMVFWLPFTVCLWIFLFTSFICDFVKYLSEFERVTKNIIFWMDPKLLLYLNKVIFEGTKDTFIPSIVQRSIKLIEHFLNDLNQNNIYYDTFMECMNDNYPFSDDITQIIFDFLCEYDNINEYMNYDFKSYRYDSDVLQNKMDEMIQNVSKIYKNDCLNITIINEKNNCSNNDEKEGQMTVPLLNTCGLRYHSFAQ